jgi:DNA-binding HxlR family transcriptional regulator
MKPSDETFLPAVYNAKNLFGGKWMFAIAAVLLDGPLHYTDILSAVRGLDIPVDWSGKRAVLHESILTRTLRRMTADELLVRVEDVGVFPPSVWYTLSPATRDALVAVTSLAEWVEAYPDLIARAQERRL